MQFSFRNLIFDIPKNFAKHYLAQCDIICGSKHAPKNSIKVGRGGKQWKKNLDQFLTLDLDQFSGGWLIEPPRWQFKGEELNPLSGALRKHYE